MPIVRKCFISYHHADQDEVNTFIDTFDHTHNVFTARGLGESMSQDIIDSTDTDYVMSRIRALYLKGSSVTLVMLGNQTWSRRYVDWELQSSLRRGQTITPNGVLGIKLPSYREGSGFPDRLNKNLFMPGEREKGKTDCYARVMSYPTTLESLAATIEEAYSRRTNNADLIVNPRDRMSNNRPV